MRKDVKFGLTVGAILVVTLIVYALVLSRSAAVKPDESSNIGAPTAPADSNAQNPTSDQQNTQTLVTNTDNSQSTVTDNTDTTPATQPTAQNDNQKFDWDGALAHGGKVSAPAPEQTVTPIARVSPDVHPPLIDNINGPSTQPDIAPPLSAPVAPPTVDAQPTPSLVPTPAPTSSTPRTHVVAEGENLWTIAEDAYGNGKYYTRIIAANPSLNPKNLKIGTVLSIPPLGESTAAANASSATPAPIDTNSQYIVVSGDNLDKIAQKLYGDPTLADRIYDMNVSVIGQDEDRLKIGMVLKLPMPPSQRQ
jgi:nucleoid-associated protein YgaU